MPIFLFWLVPLVLTSVISWRFCFRWLYNDIGGSDAERLTGGIFAATLGFWLWPLWLVVGFCKYISHNDPHKFALIIGGQTKHQKKEEKARQRRQLEAKIEKAEKELEIMG